VSVTSEFDANPQVWIMTHRFVVPIASYVGAPGSIPTGVGRLKFHEDPFGALGGCLLRLAPDLNDADCAYAFFLAAAPNNDNSAALPNGTPRFLTCDLSGCQFLAYGPNRNNLTVEHNNYVGGGGVNYTNRYNLINGQGHAVFIALRPNFAAPQFPAVDEYDPTLGANVVGVYTGTGWHFYARKKTDRQFGPTVEL
jgi:hypothetical protein